MNIKQYFSYVQNSKIVQDAKEKFMPTWEAMNHGGAYKILLTALVVTLIFLPINSLLGFISGLIGGVSVGALTFSGLMSMIVNDSFYFGGISIVMMLVLFIISTLISLIAFIITTFMISNGCYRSFRIFVEEKRVVSIGEFFKLSFIDIIPYSWTFFTNVILPLVLIGVAGNILDFIPYIKGTSIANIIISILTYAFLFRFFARIMGIDHEAAMVNYSKHWLTFAIGVYIARVVTSLSIVTNILNISFILFTMQLLCNSNYSIIDKQPLINCVKEEEFIV